MIQEIADDIATSSPQAPDLAALPPRPIPAGELNLPIDLKVKRRSKVRSVIVRGPVLKVLLGRQLAGPTKQGLKLTALGKDNPVGALPKLDNTAVGGVLP